MPSDTDELLRSLRTWLRLLALLVGLGVVALADVGYVVADYRDGLLFAIVGVAGGGVALVAVLKLLAGVLVVSGDDRPTRDAVE